MDERVEFEKWAESEGHDVSRYPAPYTNSENRNGRYQSEYVQVMWHAWRTRADVSASEKP